MKQKWIAVVLIVLAGAVLLALIPWGRNISLETTAYEYVLDQGELLSEHTISIEGRFTRRLFRENVFQGTMEISGYPETEGASAYIQFWNEHDYGIISWMQGGVPVWETELKNIYANDDFSEFIVLLFEVEQEGDSINSSWSPETGRVLTTAADYDALMELSAELGMIVETKEE